MTHFNTVGVIQWNWGVIIIQVGDRYNYFGQHYHEKLMVEVFTSIMVLMWTNKLWKKKKIWAVEEKQISNVVYWILADHKIEFKSLFISMKFVKCQKCFITFCFLDNFTWDLFYVFFG